MRGKLRHRPQQDRAPRIIPARAGQTRRRPSRSAADSDHPRACGANESCPSNTYPVVGSSPRVRGKLRDGEAQIVRVRIIPARAGQTPDCICCASRYADHPRACGANSGGSGGGGPNPGSSPRVRGKQPVGVNYHYRQRIIPARAGQTCCWSSPACWTPDHPRACGANRPILCENS